MGSFYIIAGLSLTLLLYSCNRAINRFYSEVPTEYQAPSTCAWFVLKAVVSSTMVLVLAYSVPTLFMHFSIEAIFSSFLATIIGGGAGGAILGLIVGTAAYIGCGLGPKNCKRVTLGTLLLTFVIPVLL